MRQRNMMTGFDMEQHSHPDIPTPMNPVPTLELFANNNSMFNGLPQYPPHHHQGASSLGPGMSTPPSLYLPYAPSDAPPSHPLSHVHESNPQFMGHGYKRKSDEAIPGNYQYLTEAAAPRSFLQLSTPETSPLAFPHYGTTSYAQPIDQRSVRSRVGAADPSYSQGHNSFIQGNYGDKPFTLPGPIWYDQHCNDNLSDASSSHWLQPPSIPFMRGNAVTDSIDSGHVCLPRFHEASSSRNDAPFINRTPYHLAPPPPPHTVYPPRMVSASYTVPVTIHDASYSHVEPVQSTRLRINHLHPRDDFSSAVTFRHIGLHHRIAIPEYEEDEDFEEGDFYDDVDHHEDMRLDIDDMSYEELLALSEDIGTVKTGLSEETVKDLVERRTYVSTRINLEEAPSTDLETDACTICQETYKNRDKIATLDCKHEYHAECLEKWLVIKNVCPICKTEALVMEKNKER